MTRQRVEDGTLDAAQYRHLIDQLPDVVLIVTDLEMRYVLAGGRALARTGWRAADLRGRRPRDLMPAPVAEVIERHLAGALEGRSSVVPALPGARAGAVWEAWFTPLRSRDGTVAGAIFVLRDVTSQHRLGERVRDAETRFRATIDALLDAFGVLAAVRDDSGQIVDLRAEYANPAACALFQRPLTELVGKHLLEVLPSMVPLGTFPKLVHTIETGEPTDYQVPWFEEDALTGAFEVRGAKLGDGLVVTIRDVTDRVRAEHRLRDSEERYRVTQESAAAGMALVAADGRFLQVNRRFCEITGYSEHEMLELGYADIMDPADVTSDLVQVKRVVTGEIPWYTVQRPYHRKDGSVVWVLLTSAPRRDAQGRAVEWVATVTDITAQKHAQDEVARLNAELEERVRQRTAELDEANRNLEAFTYTVSHDLRAPLGSMAGFTELLADEYGDRLGGGGLEYLARIRAAGERMDQLIGDLLTLSTASHAEIHVTAVDLSGIARATAAALARDDPGRQVRVSVEDGIRVRGDERLLRTVLENLLGNAWKFTSRTPDPAIDVGTLPSDEGTVHCYVRDNGAGFDPDLASRLFQPFSRLHGQEFDGTGVGLASVQRIITRHHGRCWAEGERGKGATFHLVLPAGPQAGPG